MGVVQSPMEEPMDPMVQRSPEEERARRMERNIEALLATMVEMAAAQRFMSASLQRIEAQLQQRAGQPPTAPPPA